MNIFPFLLLSVPLRYIPIATCVNKSNREKRKYCKRFTGNENNLHFCANDTEVLNFQHESDFERWKTGREMHVSEKRICYKNMNCTAAWMLSKRMKKLTISYLWDTVKLL